MKTPKCRICVKLRLYIPSFKVCTYSHILLHFISLYRITIYLLICEWNVRKLVSKWHSIFFLIIDILFIFFYQFMNLYMKIAHLVFISLFSLFVVIILRDHFVSSHQCRNPVLNSIQILLTLYPVYKTNQYQWCWLEWTLMLLHVHVTISLWTYIFGAS